MSIQESVMTIMELEIDWDNFDLVTALRYAEDYRDFISQQPAGAAS